jgi:hypothetical protein
MKIISNDHTYVDFRAEKVGVRVRRDSCRPIILERGRWTEYGVPYSIPVDRNQLQAQKTGLSSLAANVVKVEESDPGNMEWSELRHVITGEVEFDDVLAGSLQNV